MATTHILRVTLSWERSIYRDIEIPGGESLYALAEGIVEAFDFDFDHAFGFYSGPTRRTMMKTQPRYELFADISEDISDESDAMSVKETTVAEAFPKIKHKLMFLFDYGDEWLFRVQVAGFGETVARTRYPKTVASAGEAPEQYPEWDDDDEDDDEDDDDNR